MHKRHTDQIRKINLNVDRSDTISHDLTVVNTGLPEYTVQASADCYNNDVALKTRKENSHVNHENIVPANNQQIQTSAPTLRRSNRITKKPDRLNL